MPRTTRSDIHRPSAFQTADYRIVGYIDVREESHILNEAGWRIKANPAAADAIAAEANAAVAALHRQYKAWFGTAAAPSTCRHCGTTRCTYFAVAVHAPTGENVAIGHQCSNKIGLPSDEHQWNRLASRAEAVATARKRDALLASIEAVDPVLFAAFSLALTAERGGFDAIVDEKAKALGVTHPEARLVLVRSLRIVADIGSKARQYDYNFASTKQRDLFLSAARWDKAEQWAVETEARFAARAQADAARLAGLAGKPALAGRVTLVGTFTSRRAEHGDYGLVVKGLFVAESGEKVWCSIPSSVDAADIATVRPRLSLTVTVEQSKDVGFYFGSRPKAVAA
jgi:hypothetical protein